MSLNTSQALVELQERDLALLKLKKSYMAIKNGLNRQREQLENLRGQCETAQHDQTAAEVNLRRLELERASENQNLSTTRDRLFDSNSAPSWRDEQRLQDREQELINRIALMDERIEPVLMEANDARAKLQDLQIKLADAEADLVRDQAAGKEQMTQIATEHNEAHKHRQEAAKLIPTTQYDEYKRLWDANGGRALAKVEREVCSGCSERLSSGELNRLKEATEPQLCHCGRFLITVDLK